LRSMVETSRQFELISLHAHAHKNIRITKELWLRPRTGVGLPNLPNYRAYTVSYIKPVIRKFVKKK